MKPYVTCHMLFSVEGHILTERRAIKVLLRLYKEVRD